MLRSLLCAASIVVLLIATLFFPQLISARRCSVKMPSTLLSLYRTSDFIYVGKFDKIEEGEASKDEGSDVTIVPIKKHFSIASSLKGESRKMLVLEESEYRYVSEGAAVPEAESEKESEAVAETESSSEEPGGAADAEAEEEIRNDDEAEAVEGEATEGEEPDFQPKPGDTVLLFLSKDEEGDGLHLADDPDGLKKMTQESLAAYEVRIKELNEIFSAKDPGYVEIVAWLVRCAEDPATRWEGTYELMRSFTNLEWQEERAKEVAAEPAAAEVTSYSPRAPTKFETGDVNFAKYLTEGQKLILSNILLSRKIPAKQDGPTAPFVHGDRELIELVKRWGDSKVAATLIEQLIHDSSDPLMSSGLMSSIAAMLRDEELIELASVYTDVQWQDAGSAVEGEHADRANGRLTEAEEPNQEGDGGTADTEAPEPSSEAAQVGPVSEEKAVPVTSKKAPPKEKTYGEFRTELLAEFLDRAKIVMAKEKDSRSQN